MLNKIFKTGHSAVVALSPKVLKASNLKAGDTVKVDVDKDIIIIKKSGKSSQLDLGLKIRAKL